MRKLFLMSAFVLISAAAQAGQNRGLLLAAADTPAPVQAVETAKPVDPAPPAQPQTQTQVRPAPVEAQPAQAQPAQAQVDEPKRQAAKPVKKAHARHYEGDEAKARRIAARYGVYW